MPLPSTPSSDDELARSVLPMVEDLAGPGWATDRDEDDDGRPDDPTTAYDTPLPQAFPDDAVTATAEVTFLRDAPDVPPGIVHAIATAFTRPEDARTAWLAVADESFARRFATSVADAATGGGQVELLGPVAPPPELALDRSGRRAATHRATWSRVEAGGVLPITLDLAVLATGRCLVVLWSIDGDRPHAAEAWDHLVRRAALRCEVALDA